VGIPHPVVNAVVPVVVFVSVVVVVAVFAVISIGVLVY
jgi:hypothetical protein